MTDAETYDWEQFSIIYYYNAHITKVFRVWTEAKGLESFFIGRCVYTDPNGNTKDDDEMPAQGDSYEFHFRQGFDIRGEVYKVLEKELFSFSFGEMKVDVHFSVLDNQTEVQLIQSKIPATADGQVFGHLNCRSCWVFFMTNLTSVLESGKDLRDDNPDLVSSMEVGFNPLTHR